MLTSWCGRTVELLSAAELMELLISFLLYKFGKLWLLITELLISVVASVVSFESPLLFPDGCLQ